MFKPCFAALVILIIAFLSCTTPPRLVSEKNLGEYDYTVVTAGGNYDLSTSRIHALLKQSKLVTGGGILSADRVRGFVDSLTLDTLMGMEASKLDLRVDPSRYMLFRRQYQTFLRSTFLENEINASVEVDSSEIAEYYYSDTKSYYVDEQILASHITMTANTFLESRDSASYSRLTEEELALKLRGHIYSVYEMLQNDSSFESMAKQYSHYKRTAAEGGLIGWVKRGFYANPFDSVAFSLKEGTYSEPYLNLHGWHILYVKRHVESGIPTLTDEMMPLILTNYYNLLSNERAKKLVDSIRSNDPIIVYNDSMLESDYFKENITVWVAAVNGADSIFVYDMVKLEGDYRDEHNIANTTPEMKKEMISHVASVVVITQAARNAGVDTLPEIVTYRANSYHSNAKQIVLERRFDHRYQPSPEDVRKYYEDHIDSFVTDKPLEVQQIICEDSIFCEYIRDQALAGVDFLKLAAEHYPGDPKVRVELANLGRIGPDDVDPVFYGAASLAGIGSITHPVKTKYGYQIIKLLNRYDSKSFGNASSSIILILQKKHAEEFYEEFQKGLFSLYDVRYRGKIHRMHLKPYEDRQG